MLFYGRWSLGEGLSLGKARDATFTLTGAGTWVGKPAYLATDPLTIQEGWQTIAQAIAECQREVRGPEQPCSHLLTLQLFRFHHPGDSPQQDCSRDGSFNHQPSPNRPQRGWDCNQHRMDQRLLPPQPSSPSQDCGFKSDRSSVSTASSVLSQSDRSEASQCSSCGRWHRETRAHMKINLSVFEDEDAKDAITYLSWRWDLNVYHCAGCRDCTLLPYAIQSLQGYPGELVWSSGMDITLDNVQIRRPYQIWAFTYQDTSKFWLICFQNTSLPTVWPSWNATTSTAGYPNVLKPWWPTLRPVHRKRQSDYLWAAREVEKEDSKKLSWSPWSQVADNTTKPRVTSFFSL